MPRQQPADEDRVEARGMVGESRAGRHEGARRAGDSGALPPPARWRDLWSAGHSVSGVDAVLPVAQLVARIATEFHAAASPQGRALPGTAP